MSEDRCPSQPMSQCLRQTWSYKHRLIVDKPKRCLSAYTTAHTTYESQRRVSWVVQSEAPYHRASRIALCRRLSGTTWCTAENCVTRRSPSSPPQIGTYQAAEH